MTTKAIAMRLVPPRGEQQHYPTVLIRNRSRETSAGRASSDSGEISLKCLGSHRVEQTGLCSFC